MASRGGHQPERPSPSSSQPGDAPPPSPPPLEAVELFLRRLGYCQVLPEGSEKGNFFSDLFRRILVVDVVERGLVTFSLTVIPQLTNYYGTLHGGAVAAIAADVALACLRTVVGDEEFFLGESAVSYLSAARLNVEVDVEGRIVRQGKSIIVVSVEFKTKETQQLADIARFTFYKMQSAKL